MLIPPPGPGPCQSRSVNPDRITSDPPPEEQRGFEADPQTRTLQLTTLLSALRPDWPHRLILSVGLQPPGPDLALAAHIAGGTCLSVDPSPETCRAALRSGAVDFLVNSLDEAVRTLKNEVRKGHPLSVALQADPASVLAETLERGILPDLFTAFPPAEADPIAPVIGDAAEALARLGTVILKVGDTFPHLRAVDAADLLADLTARRGLSLETFSFSSNAELRAFDARLLTLVGAEDPRRRWTLGAPRLFSRPLPAEPGLYRRAAFLTETERDELARTAPSIS